MNQRLYTILIVLASALMLASAAIALRSRIRPSGTAPTTGQDAMELEVEEEQPEVAEEPAPATESRPAQQDKPAKTRAQRDKDKFDVGEMRNEAEDMIRRFHGTPEERQDVIEECEAGKALILAIADLAVSEYDDMSPEELAKARGEFEKEYRAELNYLQSGKLQRMLKTPEEQEVIGSTIEVVQQFLETLDNALISAGY